MRILTRYILRAHAGPFVFALSVMTGLLLVNQVARRLQELAGKGLDASVIAEVFVLSLPHIMALTLPMAVLVAVLHAFSQLAADNEISALKASGVNLTRLLVPLLVAASLLALGMVVFNDRILPETNHALKNLLVDIARKSPTLDLQEQTINEIRTGDLRTRYFLSAAEIEPATNRLRDVAIYDLSVAGRERTVYADSGRMALNREQTDLFLTLFDGMILETGADEPQSFQRLYFERQLIRVEGVGNQLERTGEGTYRTDREMSLTMLASEAAGARAELADLREDALETVREALRAAVHPYDAESALDRPASAPVNLPLSIDYRRGDTGDDPVTRSTVLELRALEARAEALRHRANSYEVEYHKKFSIPFACIVFVLLGAPLAVRFPRGGIGMVITASLVIFGIYYMGLIGGEQLADKGLVSSFWAMWVVNAVFLAFGLWGIARVGREVSTARGGGWDDLLYSLRGLVPAVAGRGRAGARTGAWWGLRAWAGRWRG